LFCADNTAPFGITMGLAGIGGQFTLPKNSSKLLLVAGGIGITPFLSMLDSPVATSEAEESGTLLRSSLHENHVLPHNSSALHSALILRRRSV
jgi:ferredoxin-NADP reductase